MGLITQIHKTVRTVPWLGRIALRSIPDVRWQLNVDHVGKMVVRLRQNRGYWLRHPLVHEGFPLGSLKRFIRKGDVVYDIGANIGLYSRFMVQRFEASHVYAFEPVPNNRALLADNLKLGGCADKVTVMPYALGDEDGTACFQVDDLTYNSGTLDAVRHGSAAQSREQYGLPPVTMDVPVIRIDTLLETQDIQKPDVMKIDVEGAEAMVVAGARRTLLKHKPRVVVEIHSAEAAKNTLKAFWDADYYCAGSVMVNWERKYIVFNAASLDLIGENYRLLHMVASADEADLLQPIEPFTLHPS